MFKFITHLRFKLNFLVRLKSSFLGGLSGINYKKRDVSIVVSISSKEENFYDAEMTIYSLLNQSVKPDKIILWLSDDYNFSDLPYGITRFIKNGLEIRFVKDLCDYTKTIYPLREYPNDIIVIASDNMFYNKNWLKKLYLSYVSNPDDVHTHIANRIKYNIDSILPFKSWNEFEKDESARFDNMAIISGGVLFPPNCFKNEVFRDDVFLKYNPDNSAIWLWFMSLLSARKTRIVKSHINNLTCINLIKFLKSGKNSQKNYDKQINNLIPFYGQNIRQNLKK